MIEELWGRLSWREDADEVVESDDRAVVARTFATLFNIGGIVAAATLLLPGDPDRFEPGIAAAAAAAVAYGVFLIAGYDRLPMWVFVASAPAGTLLATVVVLSGGDGTATAYAFYYFWVVLCAFSFLSLRAGIFNLVLMALAYAAALQILGTSHNGMRWVMAAAALTVAGLVIIALRSRLATLVASLRVRVLEQDAIAAIGKRALDTTEQRELFDWTARKVAETLGVERAAVLGLRNKSTLMVRGGAGWDPDAVRSATVPLDDPLAGPALLAGQAVLYDEVAPPLTSLGAPPDPLANRHRGIAAPIGSDEGVLGVLAVYGNSRRPFTETDARFVQAAANVLAEAKRRREVEASARHQLLYDPVTELPNRTQFLDRLGEAIIRTEQSGGSLSVFILEIDEFKLINDSYGDLFGNALLRAFAARLRRPLYLGDTVARLGGPEFAVLCEGLDAARAARDIADDLFEAMEEPLIVAGERISVRMRMGVAISSNGTSATQMMTRADAALYAARGRANDRFEVYDAELESRLRRRVALAQALIEAPDRGELSFASQPIVGLVDDVPRATECFLRWHHPELGEIRPSDFLPVAEETGSIIALGTWQIDAAAELAASLRGDLSDHAPLPLHVNVSPRQLAEGGFAAGLAHALDRAGARPSDIAIEITEEALLRDPESTTQALFAIRELGVALVLDDFGTGQSSLGHLNRLPLAAVKVDRELVGNVEDDPGDAAIVEAVVKMGLALGLDVIAEGVETAAQAQRLRDLGCPLAQGHFYAVPEPVAAMASSREPYTSRRQARRPSRVAQTWTTS
jgi:diguanylate cyclase (GGDEF)-like protein